jgi:hypothetical protein
MKTISKKSLKTAVSALMLAAGVLALGLTPASRAYASPPGVANIPNLTVNEGSQLQYQVIANDPDNDVLSYSLTNAPAGATISPGGLFSWTPNEAQGPAVYNILVNVNDGHNPTVKTQLKVTVKEVNTAPFISNAFTSPVDLQENVHNSITLTRNNGDFGDVDLDANGNRLQLVTVGASGLPSNTVFKFNKANQSLFLDFPATEMQGGKSFNVIFKVSDGQLVTTRTITFNVLKNNSDPILQTISDRQAKGGNTVTFTAKATDIDVPKDTLTFHLFSYSPTSATINPATGVFSWTTPVVQNPTSYLFNISVTDGHGGGDDQDFLIRVLPGNPTAVKGVVFTSKLHDSVGPYYEILYTVINNTPFYLRDLKITGAFAGFFEDYEVVLNGNQVLGGGDDDYDDSYDLTVTPRATVFDTNKFVLTYVGDQYGQSAISASAIDPSVNGNGLEPGEMLQLYIETYVPSTGFQFFTSNKPLVLVAGPASLSFVCDPVVKPGNTGNLLGH